MNQEHSPQIPARPRSTDKTKGFTLVELLVVIGIIALLVAILLPALNKARQQGNWATCLSNLKQIGNAMQLYAQENRGYYPRPASGSNGPQADDYIFWQEQPPPGRNADDSALCPYLNAKGDKFKTIMRCPSDLYADRRVKPGREAYGAFRYSYSMNQWWVSTPQDGTPAITAPRPKISQVHNAAEKILMIEEKEPNDGRWDFSQETVGGDDELGDRHSKQGNILWNDYHVTRLYWKEVSSHLGTTNDPSNPFQ